MLVGMNTEFREAVRGLQATGADRNARDIVESLDRHGREERELLDRYRRFGEESEAPAVQYLVKMVLEDEQIHHRVLGDLANTIAWGGVKGSDEPTVPNVSTKYLQDSTLRSETRALLEHELKDRAQLRRLRKRLRNYGHVALWELLIDLMEADTEKHIRIFRFILSNGARPHRLGWLFHRPHWLPT